MTDEIGKGDVVVLSHHLSPVVTGRVVSSRKRRLIRDTWTQYQVEWSDRDQGGIRLPKWVDGRELVIIPDVSEAGSEDRTVASVIVEEIARAFEDGDMDDAELSREGIAAAIRDRFLRD